MKMFTLALATVFSLVGYQAFASDKEETNDPTTQVEVEVQKTDTTLSSKEL